MTTSLVYIFNIFNRLQTDHHSNYYELNWINKIHNQSKTLNIKTNTEFKKLKS